MQQEILVAPPRHLVPLAKHPRVHRDNVTKSEFAVKGKGRRG